jgi:hypothetical protein
VVVAGVKGNLTGGGERLRFLGRGGEPFVDQPADHGAAHRPGHLLPRDGRAGVEDQFLVHPRNDVLSDADIDEGRFPRLNAPDRFRVGPGAIDLSCSLRRVETVEELHEPGTAARGRFPVYLGRLHAHRSQGIAESLKAEVDNVEVF